MTAILKTLCNGLITNCGQKVRNLKGELELKGPLQKKGNS